MSAQGKVIVFLGPPGSGKGTQAARLSSALDIPPISTGEMLRRECQSGSSLGKAVKTVLASGQLVGDDLINRVVAQRLRQRDCQDGCILDGYPRTLAQARFLDRFLAKRKMARPVVFDFQIETEEVVARLSSRRQCAECGRIFSVNGNRNDAELRCDQDGSELIQRADDNPETIRERLKLYEQNAGELVRYFASKDYHRIHATRTLEEISNDLLSVLGRRALAASVGARVAPLAPAAAAAAYQPQPA